ncbi:MAG: tetratricopeptide repeat protein [Bacteroidales bacterium]|nr:tetratricopeptide repeat protein [Bacteroidales bacterium]
MTRTHIWRPLLLLTLIILAGCGRIQKMHQKAYDLSEDGDYRGAIELYEKILRQKPDKPLFINDYGWTLFMADSLQRAQSVLKEAQRKCDDGHQILQRHIKKNLHITESFIRINQALKKGQPEQALSILDELNRSWKTHEMRLKYYALTYDSLGEKDKAREYWQQIIDQHARTTYENPYYKMALEKMEAF